MEKGRLMRIASNSKSKYNNKYFYDMRIAHSISKKLGEGPYAGYGKRTKGLNKPNNINNKYNVNNNDNICKNKVGSKINNNNNKNSRDKKDNSNNKYSNNIIIVYIIFIINIV